MRLFRKQVQLGKIKSLLLYLLVFASCSVFAEGPKPIEGAPYAVPNRYFSTSYGETVEDAVLVWWEKYKKKWGVEPYGDRVCSYNIVMNSNVNRVGRVVLTGVCKGANDITASRSCPDGYHLINESECKCAIENSLSAAGGFCIPPDSPPNNGNPECNGEGNPINFLSGNKYQIETDLSNSGREMALDIQRSYNSNSMHIGVFGPRWHSVFDSRLYFDDDQTTILVILDDGLGEIFRKNNESWISESHVGSELFSVSTGLWRYQSRSGVMIEFNELGQILLKSNHSGRQWTYSYSDGLISSVMDSYGSTFEFTFNGEYLNSITTPDGIYKYQYSNGYLASVLIPDDTPQDDSDNSRRQYHYENSDYPYALTGITDEVGKRYVTWGYDVEGRANLSQHNVSTLQSIEKFMFDFRHAKEAIEPRVTVTNPLNKNTTYYFNSIQNVLNVVKAVGEQSTHCAAASQYKSYYPNGTLQTQTDWEGNVTLFERDTLGRITKKTQALKWPATPQYGLEVDTSVLQTTTNTKITQTCWHASHNKPERTIEPASVTIFDYFDSGQLKSKKVEPRTTANAVCL